MTTEISPTMNGLDLAIEIGMSAEDMVACRITGASTPEEVAFAGACLLQERFRVAAQAAYMQAADCGGWDPNPEQHARGEAAARAVSVQCNPQDLLTKIRQLSSDNSQRAIS